MRTALVVLLLAFAAEAHAFTTGLRRDLPAGAGPSGVVAADFNQDGNADIAVIERDVDSLSVWFGDGTGAFAGRTRYPTGDFPRAIAAGDLNGDGRVDLAIANGVANTVTVYLGGPLGMLGKRIDYPVGQTPSGLVIGDANSDNQPDVVVANATSSTVTILEGGLWGSGLGAGTITVPTGTGCRGVALGDFDWNGVTDLVTANTTADSISIFLGQPGGGFAPRADVSVVAQPVAVAITDLNQNGRPDLVVLSASGWLTPFFNTAGQLIQGPLYPAGANPAALAISDLDLPGEADVLIGNASSGAITTLRGGSGTLLAGPFTIPGAGSGVLGLATADFDGNGVRDIVVPTIAPAAVSVFMCYAGPFLRLDKPAGTNPASVAIADLNGDAHPDFAVANFGSASITTYLNDGTGAFGNRVDLPAPVGPNALVTADFDGNLKPDLALSTFAVLQADTSRVSVFLNQGAGAFARADYDMGAGQRRIGLAVGDVTHDGKLDLVTGHQNTTTVQILPGNGLGVFTTGPTLTTYNGPTWVDLADADGNGSLDAFVGGSANFGEGRVCAFLADGAGGFAPKVDYLMNTYPSAITHGDFDEDGRLDLAVANQSSGDIRILRGDGLGGFTPGAVVPMPGAQLYSLVTVDINGDGDLDFVAGRGGTPMGIVYGRGDGTFSSFVTYPLASTQAGIAVGNLDGNAAPDLVVANNDTGNASVLLAFVKARTTLTVSPNPSAAGQALTFQATVTPVVPSAYVPQGTVRFFDGTTLLGQAALVNGVASLEMPGDYPWAREFSAAHLGDSHYFGSVSPVVPHFSYIPSVSVPAISGSLALAPIGNPARGLRVRVTLDGAAAARLTVHDVRGRMLANVAAVRDGIVDLASSGTFAPGVYLVRLAQGDRAVSARAVVL
jgi:hypothetical protein